MRHLLLAVLLAGSAQAGGIIQGGAAAPKAPGISTGAVTTAALTGDGQSGNPLGVNSSSVAVYDANRNLTVPYGVVAATGSFSGSVTASSVTARDGAIVGASAFSATGALTMASAANISLGNASAFVIRDTGGTERTMVTMGGTSDLQLNTHGSFNTKINPNGGNITTGSGNVGIGTASPGAKLEVASGTFVVNGTGAAVSLMGNVGLNTAADASYPFRFRATTDVNLRATHNGGGRLRIGPGTDASTWDAEMEWRASKHFLNAGGGTVVLGDTASPASGAACDAGTIAWDASYIYVCTASGAWKRAALTGGY